MTSEPSETLAIRAAGGDRQALAELFTRYGDSVFAYVLRRVPTRAIADDVTGDLWLRVTAKISGYSSRGDGGFAGWLFTLARHGVADYYQDAGRRPGVAPETALDAHACPADGPLDQVQGQERAELVVGALAVLTPRQRRCVSLRYFDGLSEQETADRMGLSVGAVKQLHWRAKAGLRRALEP